MGTLISAIASIVHLLLLLYLFTLFGRLILEYIPLFNRGWRPKGAGLVAAEVVYTVTDPPIKLFRRFIPPLRLGTLSLDFGFTFTMLAVLILMSIVRAFI
ncbi:YggT family protein [uncultured Microbacterium sp.]|uniref:YggT family protein n=1 Tax=uncultured Microbacterium sp. TaxID=191216 RepID=UPI002638E996|nr:YggT family protein [uncultured Microbacterium sp.]